MENDKERLSPVGDDEPMVGRWVIHPDKCTTCCECIDACMLSLLYLRGDYVFIKNESLCTQCGDCMDACAAHAIELT